MFTTWVGSVHHCSSLVQLWLRVSQHVYTLIWVCFSTLLQFLHIWALCMFIILLGQSMMPTWCLFWYSPLYFYIFPQCRPRYQLQSLSQECADDSGDIGEHQQLWTFCNLLLSNGSSFVFRHCPCIYNLDLYVQMAILVMYIDMHSLRFILYVIFYFLRVKLIYL